MTKQEYKNLCYAINCFMNGDSESSDYNPKYGSWEDGMDALCDLRDTHYRNKIKKVKRSINNG